eukprot:365135-Chlamydomonas_euryale.AAC.3
MAGGRPGDAAYLSISACQKSKGALFRVATQGAVLLQVVLECIMQSKVCSCYGLYYISSAGNKRQMSHRKETHDGWPVLNGASQRGPSSRK